MATKQMLAVIEKGFSDLRREMDERFTALRGEMNDGFTALRGEMNERFAKVDERFAKAEDYSGQIMMVVEDIRDNLRYVDDMSAEPGLAKRVSALEVRVTKLERKRK